MKIFLLTFVLCASVFGRIDTESSRDVRHARHEHKEIIEALEKTCADMAHPAILGLFPETMHSSLDPIIKEALSVIDKRNVFDIVQRLTEIIHTKGENINNPETVKALMIGTNEEIEIERRKKHGRSSASSCEPGEVATEKLPIPVPPVLEDKKTEAPKNNPVHTAAKKQHGTDAVRADLRGAFEADITGLAATPAP